MSEYNALDETQLRYLQLLTDAGCKVKFKTYLFDKLYVWLIDPHGTHFLESVPEPPEPVSYSVTTVHGEVLDPSEWKVTPIG